MIWVTRQFSMYAYRKLRNGKLIEGKGASVRRIMTATVVITLSAGKPIKRRAGRSLITEHSSRQGSNKEGET